MSYRFHVLSLPHTQTTKEYVACAYTQKALNFANMMTSLGHEVILYASEENDADVAELVTIASKKDQEKWFGSFDFHKKFFPITWAGDEPHWTESNTNAINEIEKRIQPKDFICVIAGWCQQPVARAFPNHIAVEYGIGYTGVFSDFKVFESYAHMHWVYGNLKTDDGTFFDSVIPNYFDPSDFSINREPDVLYEGKTVKVINNPSDYYVWMGRLIQRKGPEIAIEATRRLGSKLIMAGQGVNKQTVGPNGTTLYGDDIVLTGHHIEHIGHVNVEERAKLLAGAKAVFMPTTYLEPFGGVSIEALMSGTPVIATDFGAFTETIPHGVAGYRFRTIGEATQFASDEMLAKLNNQEIREYAISNFSLDRVRYLYQDYFDQLNTLWEEGFYSTAKTSSDRYTRYI